MGNQRIMQKLNNYNLSNISYTFSTEIWHVLTLMGHNLQYIEAVFSQNPRHRYSTNIINKTHYKL